MNCIERRAHRVRAEVMKFKLTIIGSLFAAAIVVFSPSFRESAVKWQDAISGTFDSQSRMAPDFELRSLDGHIVKLSDFRGKAVLLNFWATYCGPCRAEMPWLIDLHKKYEGQGLAIVGVSMDDPGEQQRVADFARAINVNYTIVIGNHSVGDAYGGVRFLPQTFFIDRAGRIIGSATGMKSKTEFEDVIKGLL